jgi:hypothetical protein
VHADGIPRSDEGLIEVLYAAPTEALEFVASQREPGARMPPLALPADRARLLDPGGAFAVLRAGNVAHWSAPVADWCRSFAAWVACEVSPPAREVLDVRAEIYLTSPNGITAFHADPSHNFTLQVRGRREIHAFSNADPRLIDERTRAGVYLHRAQYPVYRAECEDRARRFTLAPENACYIPPLTGHWIQNGDELSISYVISVRTRSEIHEKLVHGMNERLRGLGWRPSTFGSHPVHDALKASVEQRIRGTRRWFARNVLRRPSRAFLDPLDV